jgi:hypothetical protein
MKIAQMAGHTKYIFVKKIINAESRRIAAFNVGL